MRDERIVVVFPWSDDFENGSLNISDGLDIFVKFVHMGNNA